MAGTSSASFLTISVTFSVRASMWLSFRHGECVPSTIAGIGCSIKPAALFAPHNCSPPGACCLGWPVASRLHALTVLASEPEALAAFWGDLLGWERSGLELLPDAEAPLRLAFEQATCRGRGSTRSTST